MNEKYLVKSRVSFIILLRYWLLSFVFGVIAIFIYDRINHLEIIFYLFGSVLGVLCLVCFLIPFFRPVLLINEKTITISNSFGKDITIQKSDIQSYTTKRIPCKLIYKAELQAAYDEMTIKLPIKYPYNLINYQYVIYSKSYFNYQKIFVLIANETITLQPDGNVFKEIVFIFAYSILNMLFFGFLFQSEKYRFFLILFCVYYIIQGLYSLSQVRMKSKILS